MHLSEALEILRKKAAKAKERGHYGTEAAITAAADLLEPVVAGDPSDGQTNGQGTGG